MTYASTTTLNLIRAAKPCEDVWRKLLSGLGKTQADDEPLPLLRVLDICGLDDTLWVLSYAMPDDRLARHYQAWCAERVLHLFEAERPGDLRVREQIAMLRNDTATEAERKAARTAARAAARDERAAARDERDAARDERDAAWAARTAARDFAWGAADAVAQAEQEKQLRAMIAQREEGTW